MMPPALRCDDILAMIFDHLAPSQSGGNKIGESRKTYRSALASSAVTCSTLSHHALNVLWRELSTIRPLIRILPNCKQVDSQFTLSGAISDERWSRFQLYANRIRAISGWIDPDLADYVHPSVWMFLATKCKDSPLLPHLRLLALNVRLSDTPCLILLMSPSLRTLDIFFILERGQEGSQSTLHAVGLLVETLPVMAPNLESFCWDLNVDLDNGFVKALSQFARLNTVSITSLALDDGALRVLSAIATLRDLSCSINRFNRSASRLHAYAFQNLRGLRVTGPFDDLTAFIDNCQLPCLTHVTLSITEPPRAREPVDSFAVVSRRFNRALLTSFGADIDYVWPSPPPSCLIQYFEPLLAFPKIKSFQLSLGSSAIPSIHDDDLARFGAAWPQLSTFRVSCFSHGFQPMSGLVRPTLSGVVDLARRCPRLEVFRIPELDATTLPEKTATLPLGHGLRTFFVKNATVPSPDSPLYSEAATVLDRVFPSINLEDAQKMVRSHTTEWRTFLGQWEAMRLGRASKRIDP